MKNLCQNWKVKLISRGAYSLSGTRINECLEIIDVEEEEKKKISHRQLGPLRAWELITF